ncbi:MAG: peptide chain release factor N(5)-glutamine methyltransferase [Campylobacterales bacterium]|nr:peptide chain release factor N(5)-glutamine methyltransferase [Campylobacterales bacterium]
MTIAQALKKATFLLQDKIPRPRFEAELLLAHYLGVERVYLSQKDNIKIEKSENYFALVQRRAKSEPYEYITQKVSFYDTELYVDDRVLIPRPETEMLVDEAKKIIEQEEIIKIAEIGIGSGAVSIMLARMFPKIQIVATDISEDALSVAKINRDNFALNDRITLVCADLLQGVKEDFEMIVSNPPYIANGCKLECNVVDYEPHAALFGGERGYELLKAIIAQSQVKGARFLVCEMGYDQKEPIERIFTQIGVKYHRFYKDLAGFDRGFVVQF